MLTLNPITGRFGAQVEGVDLSADVSEEDLVALKQALLDDKVLVFEGQQAMGPKQQAALARRFGELAIHPFFPRAEEEPGIDLIRSQGWRAREAWHTDLGFDAEPNLISSLRAVDIPEVGRDTAFCDAEAVYASLSPTLQRMIEGLVGVRDWRHIFVAEEGKKGPSSTLASKEEYARRDAMNPPREEPLVRVNPDTGRRCLNADPVFTTHIKDLAPGESAMLLRYLFDQIHYPDFQLRVRWRPGTIVMWDNRTTFHAQCFDSDHPRVMHRAIAKGRALFPERASAPLAIAS